MIPVSFTGQNAVFAKDQPEYLPLPAHCDEAGRLTCCWKLSWRERLRVLLTGRMWQQVLTFNARLQPQKLCTTKPELRT